MGSDTTACLCWEPARPPLPTTPCSRGRRRGGTRARRQRVHHLHGAAGQHYLHPMWAGGGEGGESGAAHVASKRDLDEWPPRVAAAEQPATQLDLLNLAGAILAPGGHSIMCGDCACSCSNSGHTGDPSCRTLLPACSQTSASACHRRPPCPPAGRRSCFCRVPHVSRAAGRLACDASRWPKRSDACDGVMVQGRWVETMAQ